MEDWLVNSVSVDAVRAVDRSYRQVTSYRISRSAPTSESLIDAQWREERAHNRAKGQSLAAGHRQSYEARYMRILADLRRESVIELLAHLSVDFGMSWVDVGRFVDVSVPALRKWRSGGGIGVDKFEQLVRLDAFLQMLSKLGIADPAMWSTTPIVPGYIGSPMLFFQTGREATILDLAAGNIGPEQALDELDPEWRVSRRASFRVTDGPDGSRIITNS